MVAECRHHETRIPAAERQRSRASPVSLNLASFEGMASHALMISPIGASTEAPRKLIYGIASVAGEDLFKIALRVWGCELRARWQTYPLAANRCIRDAGQHTLASEAKSIRVPIPS
jgi:hypothetical protein